MIRAKFKVTEKTETPDGFAVTLLPVTGGSVENDSFFKFTPGGAIALRLIQSSTASDFVVGDSYYVDFNIAVANCGGPSPIIASDAGATPLIAKENA